MILINIFTKISPTWFAYISSMGDWKPATHFFIIEKILKKSIEKKINKLIVNLPPRHGKSEFISKYFPAFLLSNFKNKRIMLASYNAGFASHWGAGVKSLLENFSQYYSKIRISKNIKSKGNFKILGSKSGMYCVGAGGSITGRGADVLIIDDPVKNDKEAMSQKTRENLYRWFQSTAFTRIEPDGLIILMMTRWHEEDLAGILIKNFSLPFDIDVLNNLNGNKWIWLNLPAIALGNDQMKRLPGTPLWEFRFNTEKLAEIKHQIGDFWFSALYQQQPAPATGNIFKREHFRYFTQESDSYILKLEEGYKKHISKEFLSKFATMDLASSLNQRADYTVIVIFGLTPERDILILDVIRERFSAENHLPLIESIYQKWEPSSIGIEKVQYQISLIENAKAKGFPVVSLIPDKDKLQRALPMVHHLKEGKVFFNQKANWLDEFERELLNFPNAEHDDQVDAFSYILQMIKPISHLFPIGRKKQNYLQKYGIE
jgi:predicted phage terminase large subunit-like protein